MLKQVMRNLLLLAELTVVSLALAMILFGCSSTPVTPVQKVQSQGQKRGVLVCDVFAGSQTCTRLP